MKTKIRRGLAMLTILALIMQFTVNLSSIAVFATDEPTVAVEEQVSNEPAKTEEAAPKHEKPAPEAPKAAEQAPAPEAPKAVEQAPAPEAPKTEVKNEAPAQTESSNEVKAEAVSKEPAAEAPKTENTEANAPAETVNEIKAENAEQKAEEVNEVKNENAPAETAEAPAVNAVKAAAVSNEAAAPKADSIDAAQNSEIKEEILEEAIEEEQDEPEEEVEQGAPSAASKAAEANAGTEPRADGKITVHYTYGLSALAKYRVDGKVTPYEYNLTMTKGQTKGQTAAGTLSFFGGKNYSFSDGGYKYTFQNTFVEGCALIQDGSISPVFTDAKDADGNPLVTESTMITKVANKGNGVVILTFADGHTKELSNIADLYLSPVYAREGGWFLDAKYIDNISTGSGSWKNEGIVSSYKKTFSNPEVKSPNLTAGKYRFEYWMTDETGEKFFDGDKFTYTGAGQKAGTTRTIETYAYWQPAVAVRYIVDGAVADTVRSFDENIDIAASYTGADLDDEDYRFSGWYGDSGKIEDGDMALLPEITKEAGTYAEHDVTAFWQPAITIAYHVLDSVETVKDFGEIGVYGKTAEAGEKMRFDGWFDEDGNRIDDDAVMSAPAITAMKAGAAVINVFARFTEIKEEVVPEEEIIPSTDNETPAAPAAPATPAAPAASETVQRTNTAAPAVNRAATVIADNATPKAETVFEGTEAEAAVIEDAAAPLAAPEHNWALINLIAMIAAVAGSIIAFFRKKEENEDNAEEDDENRNMGRVRAAKAAGLLAGAVSMIAFFLTEDMSLPMVLTDRWTILMIIILAVQAVSAALVKKACESEDDEEAEAEAVAAEM